MLYAVKSVENLMKSCEWDEQSTCESIGVTVEEYERARAKQRIRERMKIKI